MNIALSLPQPQRRRVERRFRKTQNKFEATRCRILLLLNAGHPVVDIAERVGCVRATVYRTLYRFEELGEAGLSDRRFHAEARKVTPELMNYLYSLLDVSPRSLGWQRSTWTLELLALQVEEKVSVKLSPSHIRNILLWLNCRRSRPRPGLRIPFRGRRKMIEAIQRLVGRASEREDVFYLDEADIDLNPRIGPCLPSPPAARHRGGGAKGRRTPLRLLWIPQGEICEDAWEVLEHIPQKLFVRRIIRSRYACPHHAVEVVVQVKPPARFIPKGNVGEGLLAEVLLSKYVNHQPLSRLERNLRRLGVEIPTSTMVSWMEEATEKLSPILEAMRKTVVAGRIAFSDDTPLPVLREDKPGAAHRGYLWVYSDGKVSAGFRLYVGAGRSGARGFPERI